MSILTFSFLSLHQITEEILVHELLHHYLWHIYYYRGSNTADEEFEVKVMTDILMYEILCCIWSQTVQVVKERRPEYGVDATLQTVCNTRQAYYDRLKYKQTKMLESDVILSLARDARVDFPRMGANKLRIYLQPKFEMMSIDIGRDAFFRLLADNHMLVKRKRSKRKTTFSHHRYYKYPNLIRDLYSCRTQSVMG